MKKNLDERARKKAFDEIFDKFDRNKNGCDKVLIIWLFIYMIFKGTMYAKDFVREINNQVKRIVVQRQRLKCLVLIRESSQMKKNCVKFAE